MRVLISTIPFGQKDSTPLSLLEDVGAEVVINPLERKFTEEDLLRLLPDFDVLIAGTEPITRKVLKAAKRLKFISRVGIGLDSVDLEAARDHSVLVSYTPDAPAPAVAELTVGLMIDLLRAVQVSNHRMHNGIWHRYFGRRLTEVTIGLVGVGRIGSRVIRHLSGFECQKILVNDIDPNINLPTHPSCDVEMVNKETLFQNSDVISLHVPLTGKTRNLIGAKEFQMMKADALVVNTARGGIVNEADLYDALEAGRIAGAAIDVFDKEPYSGRLENLDQCLLTAHMGSMSVDCRSRMEREATEEAIRFISDAKLLSPVPDSEYLNQARFGVG